MNRWYPNGDGNKCPGSFKTSLYYPDGAGKVMCGICGRKVGMRNPITRQIAQHKLPLQAAPWTPVGQKQNAVEMETERQHIVVAEHGDIIAAVELPGVGPLMVIR